MEFLSKTILENFQTRKTKVQKAQFIKFLVSELDKNGINANIEESGSLIKSRNIVVGNVSKAKVIFTAHYDTAPKLPFPNFITPKNLLFYIFYQILILLPLFLMCFLVSFISMILFENVLIAYFICIFLAFGFTYLIATVYKGNIIKNLIMDCQSYTKYRPNETTGGIFVSWRRKEELPTGA